MTVQISEPLIYRDEKFYVREYPLGDYFARSGIANPFGEKSRGTMSCCWNGYVATWLVEDGRLYLKEIKGIHIEGENALNLETVFPGYAEGVFAHWYSGTMKFPQGEMLKRRRSPAPNIFERDLILVFRKGLLISEKVVTNKITEADEAEIAENIPPPSGITKTDKNNTCPRRLNIDPPCRLNIDPGTVAAF